MSMPALKPTPARVYHLPAQPLPRHAPHPFSKWLKSNWLLATLILFTLTAIFQTLQISKLRTDTDHLASGVSQLAAEANATTAKYDAFLDAVGAPETTRPAPLAYREKLDEIWQD